MFEWENAQSALGVVLIIALCWAISEQRARFPWRLAIGAVAAQALLVLLLFSVPVARAALAGAGEAVQGLSASTQAGVKFEFGFLAGGGGQPYAVTDPSALFTLGFRVLPVILVICALSALLWHWKVLKWLVQGFGLVFERTMGLRGAPALASAATIFMGQVEGPIFIRTYLSSLTRSELFLLLTVGMSCVAGSTVVAYATILQGVLPAAAAHVLTASLISAPAGIMLARIVVPRDPASETSEALDPASLKTYDSSIDALMRGTTDGLQIVLAIGATLIVFVALIALADSVLSLAGPVGGAPLSIERGLGLIFSPLAWAIGAPISEARTAGGLLGVKLVLTEFTAFIDLAKLAPGALSERTRVLMTYALCGFANIGSVGINVAGYSILVPERRGEVMAMVWKAGLTGFLATCLTAAVVGTMPAAIYPH
ncbi:MAG TPA: nucleoside transporter C-terminal domain-containing protein [Caulobacteraceae bacterium]|jgi:CNT family concentrative nucleoside transporter|nr:nucleoside transporter C-terminal domain-containing protein [Caulobacteraceae bacterium]